LAVQGTAWSGLAWPHVTRCGEAEREVSEARACGLGLKEGNYKI